MTMTRRDKDDIALPSQLAYRDPKEIQDFFHPSKNLVYIYMESLERTYFDPKIFSDVAPRLRKWEGSSDTTAFTDLRQLGEAGVLSFTMGGIVASQCGIPIKLKNSAAFTNIHGDAINTKLGNVNTFLPGVTCLGDVLTFNIVLLCLARFSP